MIDSSNLARSSWIEPNSFREKKEGGKEDEDEKAVC
jgi:hypothetical protein